MRDTVVDPPFNPTRVMTAVPRSTPASPRLSSASGGLSSASARPIGRRARRRRIRIRVAGLAVGLFIAAWVVIGVQMASGHDPALAASNRHTTVGIERTDTSAGRAAAAKRSSAAAVTTSSTVGTVQKATAHKAATAAVHKTSTAQTPATSSASATPVSTHQS